MFNGHEADIQHATPASAHACGRKLVSERSMTSHGHSQQPTERRDWHRYTDTNLYRSPDDYFLSESKSFASSATGT